MVLASAAHTKCLQNGLVYYLLLFIGEENAVFSFGGV